MNMVEKANRDYVGYDYYSISVDKQKISMYIDYYESFGWTLDDEIYKENISKGDLHFKRERKIMNKVELTRLQRQLEDCLNQIGSLEKSVNERASIISITIGLIGTAFVHISWISSYFSSINGRIFLALFSLIQRKR